MKLNRKQVIENATSRLTKQGGEVLNANGEITNDGFKVAIDTLTAIKQKVVEQKYHTVKVSDFMPVVVGDGVHMDSQLVWTENYIGGDFEEGITDANSGTSKKMKVDSNIGSILVKRNFWVAESSYNILSLAQANSAGNWSIVESKERAKAKAWQLGIQKTAFLGLATNSEITGLLNSGVVNSNVTVIVKDIKAMNATEFQAFLANVIDAYYQNSNSTVYPDTFILPTDDFNGLATAVDEGFPLKTRLGRLKEAFVDVTGNADFLIKGVSYCQSENNNLSLNRYVMYRRNDETSLYMDIPVDYTTTVNDTINGFDYNAVSYGQFSGCNITRPAEVLYFDYV